MATKSVLVVHVNSDMMRAIRDIIEKALEPKGYTVSVDWEEDFLRAQDRLARKVPDLVVAMADIPHDRKEPSAPGQRWGLQLLRDHRKEGKSTPFVLLAVSPGQALSELLELGHVRLIVIEGVEFEPQLLAAVHSLLGEAEGKATPKRLDIDLVLKPSENRCDWTLKGVGFPFEDQGTYGITKELLNTLKTLSKNVSFLISQDGWIEQLRGVGNLLAEQLIKSDPKFGYRLGEGKALASGTEHTRVRFTIEETVHPIMLEAIPDYPKEEFWMVQAPVYRRLLTTSAVDRYPLFMDPDGQQQKINCLIIKSDVSGFIEILGKRLEFLNNVEVEALEIEALLKQNSRIGVVKIIDRGNQGRTFKEEVELALTNRQMNPQWHIIHYAGHSAFIDNQKKGYLFLPDSPAENVDAETFAVWLREAGVQFVYLSSCHSSAEAFVFHLVKQHVPAVAGFRWDIKDDMAVKYTKIFYRHLFEKLSLEYAFLDARKELFDEKGDNPIWAAPVLVMQMNS